MKHALNAAATLSWRNRSSTLRKMPQHDRQRRWVALCGDRLVSPASVPNGEPTCAGCRESLGLVRLWVTCVPCNGTGESADMSGDCADCDGLGEV